MRVTFSNPAGAAGAAAATSGRALLALLGRRDPVEVLDELLPWLARRLPGLDDATLRRPEKPGRWALSGVVQRLADSDRFLSYRLKMMLTEDRPPIQGYDQDRWAGELHY